MKKAVNICLLAVFFGFACSGSSEKAAFRDEMRNFVTGLSTWARTIDSSFIVIPQNGNELLTLDGEADGEAAVDYIAAIDGTGREDLYYGYNSDNTATPASETEYMKGYLDRAITEGLEVLVTDYCSSTANMEDSYSKNNTAGYIAYAAEERDLNMIPNPDHSSLTNFAGFNTDNISSLGDAQNFLYLLEPSAFATRAAYVSALDATEYDMFIIDLFYEDEYLTAADITNLKSKPGGQSRLVIAYMSIGEAEDYRYYWQEEWNSSKPPWLAKENPNWEGNYKVRYWYPEWQAIIYGNTESYLQKIITAGFDGVYLDIIDAFEYFE